MNLYEVTKSVLYLPSLIYFTSLNLIYSTFYKCINARSHTHRPMYYEDMNRHSHTIIFITSRMNTNAHTQSPHRCIPRTYKLQKHNLNTKYIQMYRFVASMPLFKINV